MRIRMLLSLLFVWIPGVASAGDLEIGRPVPEFSLQGVGGIEHRFLDEHDEERGRALVVAWFPKAFTPG